MFSVNQKKIPYAMSLFFFTILGPLGKGCSNLGAADVDSGQTNVHLLSLFIDLHRKDSTSSAFQALPTVRPQDALY